MPNTLFRLQSYRIVFYIGGDLEIYRLDKYPCMKVMSMCSLLLIPGSYPVPEKDKFGIFAPDSDVRLLDEEQFVNTWCAK